MIMGFVDVLKRNGYQVEVRGNEITAVKGAETYRYVLKSFGRREMERYDMGLNRDVIVYSDGKEIACDRGDSKREHDSIREFTILQQLGILHDSHGKGKDLSCCCGFGGGRII